jgi:hypothetical protein
VAEVVVHGDGGHPPVLERLRRVIAERVHRLARGEIRAHQVLRDPPLRQVVGRGEIERRQPVALDVGHERVADVAQQHAIEHVDAILRHELTVLGLRGGGIALVIFLDELDLAPGDLVVDLLERHLETVEHVLARRGEYPGQGTEVAHADGLGAGGRAREQQHGEYQDDGDAHHDDLSGDLEGCHGFAGAPRALGRGSARGRSPPRINIGAISGPPCL